MELLKATIKLTFAAPFHPWREMREIVRVGTGNPSAELAGNPLVLDTRDEKQRVVIEVRSVTLAQENLTSLEANIDPTIAFFTRLHEASNLPSIRQIRHDAIFIEPYALPFHELLNAIKEKFLRSCPVVDSATDVGLVFDQHEGDMVKHIMAGPMQPEQLRSQFLVWPRDDIPQQFAFVMVGCEQNNECAFDAASLRGFLTDTMNWQMNEAASVLGHLTRKRD